ncbi:MAG: toll/interleukin-1 receptor domain-containing protein [Fibrobacteres bacterium]|nr:toll/interleukin-1 receptor domain-containing protein [Fibrobacterota bacterium]
MLKEFLLSKVQNIKEHSDRMVYIGRYTNIGGVKLYLFRYNRVFKEDYFERLAVFTAAPKYYSDRFPAEPTLDFKFSVSNTRCVYLEQQNVKEPYLFEFGLFAFKQWLNNDWLFSYDSIEPKEGAFRVPDNAEQFKPNILNGVLSPMDIDVADEDRLTLLAERLILGEFYKIKGLLRVNDEALMDICFVPDHLYKFAYRMLREKGFIKDFQITASGRDYYQSLLPKNQQITIGSSQAMPKKKIFISYVRENKTQIDAICKSLKSQNIDYWIDRDSLEPGRFWKDSIKKAIKDGAYFLACFSLESISKSQTYMNEEILLAVEMLRQKPYDNGWFLPIKLSECEIPDIDIGGSRTLNDIQCAKLHEDWTGQLTRIINVILGNKPQDEIIEKYSDALSNADPLHEHMIYQALKGLLEANSGVGFHNADQGHPQYRMFANGQSAPWDNADGPEQNRLFQLLSKLSKSLKARNDTGYIWWYDFSDWQSFCKFAVDAYDKKRRNR